MNLCKDSTSFLCITEIKELINLIYTIIIYLIVMAKFLYAPIGFYKYYDL